MTLLHSERCSIKWYGLHIEEQVIWDCTFKSHRSMGGICTWNIHVIF